MAFDLAELSRRIRALGTEISPEAIQGTAALYAPFHEREPYSGVEVTRDLYYGQNERHRLDVFRNAAASEERRPVMLFVHGGGFVGGDKRNAGSPYNDNVALWAARHGLVGVNMTYRLAPEHRWPAGAEDVAEAVAWVRENIAAHDGDPRRVFVMGTSAGAVHVASYVAHNEFHPAGGVGIAGAILMSGMYDHSGTPNPMQAAYYGEDADAYQRASTLAGLVDSPVPLLFVLTEMDPNQFQSQGLGVVSAFVARSGRWPNMVYMLGHNHLSSTMHLNTPDGFLSDRLLDFIGTAAPT